MWSLAPAWCCNGSKRGPRPHLRKYQVLGMPRLSTTDSSQYRGRSLVFVRRGKRNRLSSVGALSVADRFVKFYAWQSIFFTMAWIGLTIAWTVFTEIFEAVTGGFLLMLLIPIDCVLTLAGIGYWVFLMYRAYQGKQYKIPLLGKLAEIRANK